MVEQGAKENNQPTHLKRFFQSRPQAIHHGLSSRIVIKNIRSNRLHANSPAHIDGACNQEQPSGSIWQTNQEPAEIYAQRNEKTQRRNDLRKVKITGRSQGTPHRLFRHLMQKSGLVY